MEKNSPEGRQLAACLWIVWLGVGRSAQDVCYISEVKGEVSRLCSAEEK